MSALQTGRPRQRGRPSTRPADELRMEAIASVEELCEHDLWERTQVEAAYTEIGLAMVAIERGNQPAAYRRLCRARQNLQDWAKKDTGENRLHRRLLRLARRVLPGG